MSARTYSEDMQCRICGSNRLRKYGHSRGRQPHSCGDRHCKFTSGGNLSYYSEAVKRQALNLCGEGMSISAISGVMEVGDRMMEVKLRAAPLRVKKICQA